MATNGKTWLRGTCKRDSKSLLIDTEKHRTKNTDLKFPMNTLVLAR